MFRSPRAVLRLVAAGGALLAAGLPLGTHAEIQPWSSTLSGVTTLSYQAGRGLELSPLACGSSAGTFTATMMVSFVTTGAQYVGPATITATFTSVPGDCSNVESSFGQLSNATMFGEDPVGNNLSCDLSAGGTAEIPGSPAFNGLWDFGLDGGVPCSINSRFAGDFGVGMEGAVAITGVSATQLQATEVQMVGALSFSSEG